MSSGIDYLLMIRYFFPTSTTCHKRTINLTPGIFLWENWWQSLRSCLRSNNHWKMHVLYNNYRNFWTSKPKLRKIRVGIGRFVHTLMCTSFDTGVQVEKGVRQPFRTCLWTWRQSPRDSICAVKYSTCTRYLYTKLYCTLPPFIGITVWYWYLCCSNRKKDTLRPAALNEVLYFVHYSSLHTYTPTVLWLSAFRTVPVLRRFWANRFHLERDRCSEFRNHLTTHNPGYQKLSATTSTSTRRG